MKCKECKNNTNEYLLYCVGCMKRLNMDVLYGGRKRVIWLVSVFRGLFTRKSNKDGV